MNDSYKKQIKCITIKKITFSAIFLAFGILIPFITAHAFAIPGTILLPMHISVFVAGMILGPSCGFIVGLLTPLISMLITGMPNPIMIFIMTPELAFYGLISGYLYYIKKQNIYLSLIISMITGRFFYALSLFISTNVLLLENFSKVANILTAITTGIVGIIIHILIIPVIVKVLKRCLKYE